MDRKDKMRFAKQVCSGEYSTKCDNSVFYSPDTRLERGHSQPFECRCAHWGFEANNYVVVSSCGCLICSVIRWLPAAFFGECCVVAKEQKTICTRSIASVDN